MASSALVQARIDPDAHDAWVRQKVLEALEDTRPAVPNQDVESHFAARREATRKRISNKR
ncbi:hypothetical protein [Pandoraea horticolens]|uniref:hypothetical protein n=1 Tax=Pandoraea horticolens TaxID=2508298 RepID=UPI0012410D2E|nr:hypothetical protein [Pandoraea horticolens]